MSFSRVAQLDGILLNGEVDKMFAEGAVRVVRNFTGARFDIDPEVGALTKLAVNILHILRFDVTPGPEMFGLFYKERDQKNPGGFLRARICGCAVVFCLISYLKSRQFLQKFTKIADVVAILNFVAFLINGIYPSFGERLFDLRLYSQTGPSESSAMAGHHRELIFHLFMEILDNVNRINFNMSSHNAGWLSVLLKKWFSKSGDNEDNDTSSSFSCAICRQLPVNAVRGGASALAIGRLNANFCDCYYCHSCFFAQMEPDLVAKWDSRLCPKCRRQFPLPGTNYL